MNITVLITIGIFVCAAGAIVQGVRIFMQARRAQQQVDGSPSSVLQIEGETPTCFCGEIATERMPTLERSRDGSLTKDREHYAAPPKYHRSLDMYGPPRLCRTHAHVADAKMDEFIYTRVRAILAEANARIAVEAAGFEKETLIKNIQDSLTQKERQAVRRPMNGTAPQLAASNQANSVPVS